MVNRLRWPVNSRANARRWRTAGPRFPLDQQIEQRQRRLDAAVREQANLAEAAEQGRHRLAALAGEIERIQQSIAANQQTALDGLATQELTSELMERRTAASVVAARFASHETMLQNQQRTLNQQLPAGDRREGDPSWRRWRRNALTCRPASRARAATTSRWPTSAVSAARIEPAEQELATLEAGTAGADQRDGRTPQAASSSKSRPTTPRAGVAACPGRGRALRHEIEHDVGLVELEADEGEPSQSPLPPRPVIERLPVVEMLPDGTRTILRRLRGQYSRPGSVNPNAPEEYALQERISSPHQPVGRPGTLPPPRWKR